jgi:penicillin-binding protein 2
MIQKALWNVVNVRKGTAWKSRVKGLDICGKTGTAQVIGRKEKKADSDAKELLEKFKDHAWFIAYAPAGSPKIAVAVIVEHGEHGSSTAAPIAQALIQYYLKPSIQTKTPVSGHADIVERH